jgi:hypothetical protein
MHTMVGPQFQWSTDRRWENCVNTTQQYRAVVTCVGELRGGSGNFDGPYVNPGVTPKRVCPVEGGTQWLATSDRPFGLAVPRNA